MKLAHLQVRLDEELKKKLSEQASQEDRSMSYVACEAIEFYLRSQTKPATIGQTPSKYAPKKE